MGGQMCVMWGHLKQLDDQNREKYIPVNAKKLTFNIYSYQSFMVGHVMGGHLITSNLTIMLPIILMHHTVL